MRSVPITCSSPRRGFTIIELLAAIAVLIVLLGIVVGVINSVSATMRRASGTLDSLANARAGFDLINNTLSQATLNTYWDYDNPSKPSQYIRQSDLQFVVKQNSQDPGYGQELFFVAPQSYASNTTLQSTKGLLNACGIYVRFGSNKNFLPTPITTEKYRYRLMLGILPTEQLSVFNKPARSSYANDSAYRNAVQEYWDNAQWMTPLDNSGTNKAVTPLADNIIALVAWPRLSTAEDPTGRALTTNDSYTYNSQPHLPASPVPTPQPLNVNQLPPVVQVTMIAISEASATRLDRGDAAAPTEIQQALSGKFLDVKKYQQDLDDVAAELSKNHIEFQIYSTAVPLRESKWSKAQ